jgi:peptidoglycan/xylan/chitin deacetylase (PgdA/CDA1 family)
MAISTKNIVFTYHGLHSRELKTSNDERLFRNSISERSYREQLAILRGAVKEKGVGGGLFYKGLFRNGSEIVLTFDDGYANSFRAAEIFYEMFGTAPLTIFLTTNLVGSSRSIWTVEIALLILEAQFLSDRIEFDGDFFDVGSTEDRLKSFDSIRCRLKEMNAQNRECNCESIREQALPDELERLICEYPEFQMLRLDEIKQMQSMGVRFQPHGHNHELFHVNQDSELIRKEIVKSKEFIETKLNEECSYFAYPNGDYCEAAISVLKENGFCGAYTTNVGVAETLENDFEIPRLTASSKPRKFKRQLRGKTN